MIDPYRMVIISVVSLMSLLIFLVTWRFVLHKKINYFYILIFFSILPVINIFKPGVFQSGDLVFHIYNAIDFYSALKDVILIPSWSANLNSGFGHPLFIFIYTIPYYLISFLHFLGVSWILSGKLILAFSYIFSGIFMWMVLKKFTKNSFASFAGSIIYLFSPYHLVALHHRVAIPEHLAFALAPLNFYILLRLKENPSIINILWLSLFTVFLFMTHPAMFIIYTGLFFAYVLFLLTTRQTNFRFLISFITSYLLGLMATSFIWIPRITLTHLTHSSFVLDRTVSFVEPLQLLFTTWRWGFLFQGPNGELSFSIGYGGIFILILSVYILIRRKQNKFYVDILFWTFISISTIFIMLPFSKPIWDSVKYLNLMLFSYRFLQPLIFSISILTAYLTLIYIKKKLLIFIFLFLVISYTILNWGNRGMIPEIDDRWILNNLPNGTKEGEMFEQAVPLWWNMQKDFLTIPDAHLEIVSGEAQIKEVSRSTINHKYIVSTTTPTTLVENTLYFPDWHIKINGKRIPIDYKNENYNARMVFSVPEGLHLVEVEYEDIYPLKIAKKISIFLIFVIFISLVIFYTKNFYKKLFP